MAAPSLEERVSALESELAGVKERLNEARPQPAGAWWKKLVGIYRDDPEFAEAMRLGREYRESLRPNDGDNRDVRS